LSQGPEVTILFATAEGIEAGKTKIKMLNVDVGTVESAGLSDDLEHVIVRARLEGAAEPLLREDTQFWVVRPRVGTEGVSGLSTLLSGGYIQLAPGTGATGRREFVGLDDPPVTPAGTPGLHFELLADHAGSVSAGDPILHKDFRVGRIDDGEFDVASQQMRYGAFIEAPYDSLVTSATRFWDASGISMSVGADGVEIDTASLESLLIGGVAMGLPEGVEPGKPVQNGAIFQLYPDHASVNEQPYLHSIEYVVRFPQSVRGLQPGAPVEYRGIRAGRVERILLEELAALGLRGEGSPIPVLIRVEPGRLKLPDSEEGTLAMAEAIQNSVSLGMRATLATGSLITGSLYVALDIYPDESPAEMGSFAGHPTIPTVATGLAGIEQKVAALLDKLNALPLEGAVEQAERTLADLNAILGSESMKSLPGSVDATLAELRETLASVSSESALQQQLLQTVTELDRTLQSLRDFLELLDEQPNALIFNRAAGKDPQPPAGSP
jgi:paraquat-inducible protein B